MPTNYYQGLEDQSEQEPRTPPSDTESTLVPKSLVGEEVEVGDVVKLKVEHIYEDEVEVSFVSDESESEDELEDMEEDEAPMMMGPMDEIDSMAKG